MIGKWQNLIADDLTSFMTLASDDQNIARARHLHGGGDGGAAISHVDGEGVVGEQPLLRPGESHDYVSGCPLPTPSGMMEGQYRFIREDGTTFLAEIPRFTLVAPATAR